MDNILELLIKNKEWLFSGIGIVLIVGLFSFFRKLINRKKKESVHFSGSQNLKVIFESPPSPAIIENKPASYSKPVNIIPFETLGPDEIYSTIKDAPLLQQDEIIKHYIGLKVEWEGTLSNAEKKEDDIVRMLIFVSNEYIQFDVNKNDYPGLGLLKRGAKLTVEGVIGFIGGYFKLNDAKIISIIANHPKST